MRILLDTHALLWWLDDSPRLTTKAREAIADGGTTVYVSAAVIWEIRIKEALGKLRVPAELQEVIAQQGFEPLPVTADHAHALVALPMHHHDPFDRMLVTQARAEGMTLVTHDRRLAQYGIRMLQA